MSRDFPDILNNAPSLSQTTSTNDDAGEEALASSSQVANESEQSHSQINSPEGHREHRASSGQHIASPVLRWKDRIKYFTWTWFTIVMATGGIANVINSVPYRFHGLYTIGVVFLLLAIVIFVINCIVIGARFYTWPGTLLATFVHPTESFFIPAFMISIATILVGIVEYGMTPGKTGPWLASTMVVMFWVYVVLAMFFSTAIYVTMFSTQSFAISRMTPVWIFPAYPLLLIGPFAGNLSKPGRGVSNEDAVAIIVGGVIFQGMGFLLALTMHATYVYRLMTQKLPEESARPAMFISVGPSAFTVSGLVTMGSNIRSVIPSDFMGDGQLTGEIAQILAYWASIWLFGIALFFFFLAVAAHWSCVKQHTMRTSVTWNAFIFPNTALMTAIFGVATALDSSSLNIAGSVLTVVLIIGWVLIMIMLIRAVVLKQILWPFGQEDYEHPGDQSSEQEPSSPIMSRARI